MIVDGDADALLAVVRKRLNGAIESALAEAALVFGDTFQSMTLSVDPDGTVVARLSAVESDGWAVPAGLFRHFQARTEMRLPEAALAWLSFEMAAGEETEAAVASRDGWPRRRAP